MNKVEKVKAEERDRIEEVVIELRSWLRTGELKAKAEERENCADKLTEFMGKYKNTNDAVGYFFKWIEEQKESEK
jgi:hypothetical protein